MAGRVLSNDGQRMLDELLVEPAELCCPITLQLISDAAIASDGCVYERAAIAELVRQRKLSPMTHEPLGAELVPAPRLVARVLAFMVERGGALLDFVKGLTGGHGNEVKTITRRMQGRDANKWSKVECFASVVAETGEDMVIVSTALDRVQVYVSALLAAERSAQGTKGTKPAAAGLAGSLKTLFSPLKGGASGGEEANPAVAKLVQQYYERCKQLSRPMGSDVLGFCAPAKPTLNFSAPQIELTVRVMTGQEMQFKGLPSLTVGKVCEQVLSKLSMANKARTLNHHGKRLPPASKLAEHQIIDGSQLYLVPPARSNPSAGSAVTPPLRASYQVLAAVDVSKGREQRLKAAREQLAKAKAPKVAGGTVSSLFRTTPAAEARALEIDKERAYGEPKEGVAGAKGQAKSLYHRCGGIFGVAAFVDRCMDAWMADPTLNANDRVATWHQRAQRCGFKFLVTQLMGYLCGGPQVYTGLDMAASHKHLAISEEEWGSFMRALGGVCAEFALPADDTTDLVAVVASMQADCTLGEGEEAPPNPGRAAPAGYSLYARCGGAYPLALFADRLVDALLGDPACSEGASGHSGRAGSPWLLSRRLSCCSAPPFGPRRRAPAARGRVPVRRLSAAPCKAPLPLRPPPQATARSSCRSTRNGARGRSSTSSPSCCVLSAAGPR